MSADNNIKPDFFIVGAPKCGTTAFDVYLNAHPKINMIPKEMHFFGKDLIYREFDKHLEQNYTQALSKAKTEDTSVGEGAVWYLVSESAASELKTFSPNSKVLIFLRNPVEAIYSLHSNMVYNGNEPIESFENALNNQEKRKTTLPEFYNCPTIAYQYQKIYLYHDQVKRYFDVFGEENVKIIVFEEFLKDKNKEYKETLRFLGVDNHTISFDQINANKTVRSKSIREFIFEPKKGIKSIVKTLIPYKPWREKIKQNILNVNSKHVSRSDMNSDTHNMLKAYYKEDIEKLEKLLNKDLRNLWK